MVPPSLWCVFSFLEMVEQQFVMVNQQLLEGGGEDYGVGDGFPPFASNPEHPQGNPAFIKLKKYSGFYRVHYYLGNPKHIRPYVDEGIKLDGVEYQSTLREFGEVDAEIIEKHKERAQEIFALFKKKECERKRRYRKKGKTTKEEPKFLLNRCGICNKLRPALNIFWGELMCEKCYFTPSRIRFVMERRFLEVEKFPGEGGGGVSKVAVANAVEDPDEPFFSPTTPPLMVLQPTPLPQQPSTPSPQIEEDEEPPPFSSPVAPECSTPQWPITQSSSSSPIIDFETYQFEPMDFLEEDFILEDE